MPKEGNSHEYIIANCLESLGIISEKKLVRLRGENLMEEKHKSKIVWVLFIVIAALVGLNIYQWYIANDVEEIETTTVAVVTSATPTAITSVSATPTTSTTTSTIDTSNWQTYNGTGIGGYTIKYPSNWIFVADNLHPESQFHLRKENVGNSGDYWIDVIQIGNKDYAEANIQRIAEITDIPIKNVTINNYSAKMVSETGTQQSPGQDTYLIDKNGTYYYISVLYANNNSDGVGKAILDTLQFN